MSSYTSRIRLEKQIPGQNDNTWGTVLNGNVIDLVDDSIAAYTTITVSSVDVTLTQANGASDQARSAFLDISGALTGNVNVVIPALSKGYGIRNSTSGSFTVNIKTLTGTGQYIPQGQTIGVVCDGVSVRDLEVPGIRSTSNVVNVSVGTSKIDIKVPMAVSGTVSITGGIVVSGSSTMVATTFSSNISMLAQSDARFYDADSSNYIGLQAPSSVSANIVYNLPATDGATGNVLQTNGAGSLSFTVAMPTGAVIPFAGTTTPTSWLFCYGQAINRTTYSVLFDVIGTTYGVGDGSTTFNIPDLRGRLVAGQDDMGGTSANRLTGLSGGVDGDVLGASGGAETHTLTAGQLPTAATYQRETSHGGQSGVSGSGLAQSPAQTALTGANNEAHNNVQPTLILNYIIRAV
jgi:microcystin-dependent protein